MKIRYTSFPKQQRQAAESGNRSACHLQWTTRASGSRGAPRRQRGTLANPAGRLGQLSEDCIRDVGVLGGLGGVCDLVLHAHKAARLV
jgi:hypothetical protein